MDPIIFTPRLRLILLQQAERGSKELDWLHQLRSNEQSTWHSIWGVSKTIEDTINVARRFLPSPEEEPKTYRVSYAVHKLLELPEGKHEQEDMPAELVGLVNLVSLGDGALALPEDLALSPAAAAASDTLVMEIAYMFLPTGWGQGYATESVRAVLETCERATMFWAPFEKVYIRSIVNEENPPSRRVMDKSGMIEKGVYNWRGEAIWLAGRWQDQCNLHIYSKYLLE